MSEGARADPATGLVRAVSRWQIVAISINDVVGSGIYLLPAAAAALLGVASVWAVLLAAVAVGLLILCYASAASYFDQPGGAYLYTREAFGDFIGFEVGWLTWLTRISSVAALANGLALASGQVWPAAESGGARALVIAGSIGLVTWINVIGVRAGAGMAVVLTIAKMLPLAFFVLVGVFFIDWSALQGARWPGTEGLAEAALLLLFAYAGFENTPAAAGEFRNPRRDVPFALFAMLAIVTITYVSVQVVALGTLPGLAESSSPLAEAAGRFAGAGAALLLTVGAVVSILGNVGNTTLSGPRYLFAMAVDGYGPAWLARVHPRYRTPAGAILVQSMLALALALTGSFVQLALLSVVTRLFTHVGTTTAVMVLRPRFQHLPQAFNLPGGALIPVLALLLSLGLLATASWQNLAAAGLALVIGAGVYKLRRQASG